MDLSAMGVIVAWGLVKAQKKITGFIPGNSMMHMHLAL